MSGSTLIMAPAGYHSSSSAYSPSSSSGLSPSQSKTQFLNDDSVQRPSSGHRRALSDISLPNLPSFEVPSFDNDFELDTSVFNKGKSATSDKSASYAAVSESPNTPQRFSFARTRTGPISERPRSWFPSSRSVKAFALDSLPLQHESPMDEAGSQQQDKVAGTRRKPSLERSMTTSDTFASFAKRSWLSTSRSSSPQANERPRTATLDTTAKTVDTDEKAPGKQPKSRKRPHFIDIASLPRPSSDGGKVATPKAIVKASTYLNKLKQKQASFTGSGTESDASSATSFAGPPSTSTDTRTSQSTSESDCPTADESTAPKIGKDEDPLWSSFKTLELDFKGFTSKQTNQKIIQVQEVLMPFLCRTSPDDTIRKLSSENVERRASILNKWWSAILDMIDGSGQHPIPGVDRPFILETTLMIMMRSEWRQQGSGFLPLAERSPTEHVRSRTITESTLGSSQAAFLNESAEHNVRTMFVSNLVKQMGIVVDKMSLRDAPLSLVNFSGKTCAYAFFFAPGIADVLLRLWGLTPDLIKRTALAFGLPRRSKGESDDIVSLFPENLATFGWTSHRMLWDGLKRVPKMPLLVARIAWTGPWVSRWKGLDSDLFFIFTKYFHVLAEQFMPTDLPLVEKARSPAFVLVQAQLLAVLDTTIHRQAALQQAQQLPVLDSEIGVDATALAMPLSPSNMMKSMADNTLVVLLRNVLSDDSQELHGAKQTFAEAFGMLMKAAARRTSRYDNASCFSLCDFLEETFRLYGEYDDMLDPSARVDWKFWVDVFKMMMGSHNTMSEVRMLSFVFSIWDVLARTPEQKTTLCMDWLLTRETFDCFFNHWCPMVRAYYQRLLCWRVCRDVGRANEADTNIFMTVAARLKTVWAHYLYLKHDAALAGRISPSTAPTLPTPGKKFIIIRHEVNTPQPGLFMGFDSFAKLPNNATTTLDAAENDTDERPESKKRWSLIGKMLGIGNGEESEKDGADARSAQEKNLQDARQEVAETRGRSLVPPRPPPKPSTSSDSICSSPVFEEQKHIFRFVLGWQQPAPPPRDRMLTKPRLPGPAQARVTVRTRGGSPPPPHASRPPVTRAFSGSPVVGLINGARNASPATDSGETTPRRPSASLMRSVSSDSGRASQTSEDTAFLVMDDSAESSPSPAPVGIGLMEPMTKPVKPTGIYEKNAVYCGRALAEWSLVVFECNNFVDRRREEGVLGLSEVEVPVLGMEGFRKLGG